MLHLLADLWNQHPDLRLGYNKVSLDDSDVAGWLRNLVSNSHEKGGIA
jgi:pterin-4a-carbinolamine dehydratase